MLVYDSLKTKLVKTILNYNKVFIYRAPGYHTIPVHPEGTSRRLQHRAQALFNIITNKYTNIQNQWKTNNISVQFVTKSSVFFEDLAVQLTSKSFYAF